MNNTKHLILDLTKAKIPMDWPDYLPKIIPIKRGEYYHEYDVDEERIPGFSVRSRLYKYKTRRQVYYKLSISAKVLPTGFNKITLPRGAKIYVDL